MKELGNMITFLEYIYNDQGISLAEDEYNHCVIKTHGKIKTGDRVKIVESLFYNNILYAKVIAEDGTQSKIPITKLNAPTKKLNNGQQYEVEFAQRLKEHKLMPEDAKPAGNGPGIDFFIRSNKKDETHNGHVNGSLLNGEAKHSLSGDFGQFTVNYHPEKGWHITDTARKNQPNMARHVESSGVLDRLNTEQKNPIKKSFSHTEFTINHPNLEPVEDGYLHDHKTDILHVGGHGTYRVGETDTTGHGLPRISGNGQWRVRQKQKNNGHSRMLSFQIPAGQLKKSHVDLDNDDHLHEFKKTLGI